MDVVQIVISVEFDDVLPELTINVISIQKLGRCDCLEIVIVGDMKLW